MVITETEALVRKWEDLAAKEDLPALLNNHYRFRKDLDALLEQHTINILKSMLHFFYHAHIDDKKQMRTEMVHALILNEDYNIYENPENSAHIAYHLMNYYKFFYGKESAHAFLKKLNEGVLNDE